MKQGKRLTLKQKMLLKSKNLNPDNWLVTKNLSWGLYLLNRQSGKERVVFKEEG